MTTIGATGNLTIWGKNLTVTLGGDQRGQAQECDFKQNYRLMEEEVAGTFAPTIGTGVYHGELTVAELWTTDTDLLTLMKPASNGDIPISTCTFADKDTNVPTTKTYTATCRLNDLQHAWKKGDFVIATIRSTAVTSFTDGTTSFP